VLSGGDFRRLWAAYAISEFGTAIGLGALPLLAVLALNVNDLQVSLLAALAGVAGALLALPLGPWVEFRRKRPVMIGADLFRFVALISIPLAAALGTLTHAQLLANMYYREQHMTPPQRRPNCRPAPPTHKHADENALSMESAPLSGAIA